MNQDGMLIAKLAFRTTGSIVHTAPLALAHVLRAAVTETNYTSLGDLLIAYLGDIEGFQSALDTDADRGKKSLVTNFRSLKQMTKTRNFEGFVMVIGLEGGKGSNQNFTHPDNI